MPLQAVENRRLYRQIADQIAALIERGEYAPGSRLPPERDLAEQLGVSRPSVREALIALEVEGVIEVRGGAGIFVRARKPARRKAVSASATNGHAFSGQALNGQAFNGQALNGTPPGPFDLIRARWIVE